MAQLMKQTLVFGASAIGLAALIQGASADTETKSMTLAEVKAENAKRIAAYESEKREIDERNRVKRAQYRDAYAHYAEFANRGEAEPKAPEYEALPTLELLDEPIELPFDVAGATPHESTFMSEHNNNVAIPESSSATVSENDKTEDDTPSGTVVAELHETTEKSDTLSNVAISEVNETTEKLSSDGKVSEPETHSTKTKETGEKTSSDATTSETKETGEKTSSDTTTSETKETGEKTSSDAVAAQLNGEKTSSDAVAAQLNKESEKTTTSSSDAAAQVSKIESEKASTATKSDAPAETTSSTDASAQVAKLEAEKLTTTKSDDVTPATTVKSDANPKKTDDVGKTNTNGNTQARNLSNTTANTSKSESTAKDKTQETLPHTGDSGGLVSLMGAALSGIGAVSLRRRRK